MNEEQFKQLLEALKGVSSGGRRPTGPRVERDEREGADNKAITEEIERQNKAYEEQEEIIKKLEKEYSNLTQGITRKYKLEEAKAIRDHSAALKQLAIDLENGTKNQEQYNTAVDEATEKMEAAREAAAGQKGMSDALTRVATSATGLTLKSGSLTEKMVNLGNQLNAGAAKGGSMKVAMGDMMKSMGKAGALKAVEL